MDGAEPHPSKMHGMSAERPVPTGSSTERIVCAASVPDESSSLGGRRFWLVHSVPWGQRSATAGNSPAQLRCVVCVYVIVYVQE